MSAHQSSQEARATRRPFPGAEPTERSWHQGHPDVERAGGAPGGTEPDVRTFPEAEQELPPDALRVLTVDDDPRIRTLVRMLLQRSDEARVIAETDDGQSALEAVHRVQPDVVLLDLLMPRAGGAKVLPDLVKEAPRTMVLVLSALSGIDEGEESLSLGAFAYLEKSVVGPQLADEIRELHGLFQRALAGEKVWMPTGPPRIRR